MARKARSSIMVEPPPQPVVATVLGGTRLAPGVREAVLHADPAPLHVVAMDGDLEAALAQVEDLLGRGQFGAALRALTDAKPAVSALAPRYDFVRQEKMGRAQIGVAERYRARGDEKSARTFYAQALAVDAGDPQTAQVATLAVKAFDGLHAQRAKLIDGLQAAIRKKDFTGWCGQKRAIDGLTILDVAGVRAQIYPDFRVEDGFGERPPVTAAGYLDPLPVESELIAFSSPVPGSIFRARTDAAVDVDAPQPGVPGDPPADRVHASLAFPVMANVLVAKLGCWHSTRD